ncbi:hypothetical protein CW304_00185 [Bacillus sp. UFRGS-B20]|nr:hypothetical protein CW304_00185 [Bacillus sp. UFRGS-B20]
MAQSVRQERNQKKVFSLFSFSAARRALETPLEFQTIEELIKKYSEKEIFKTAMVWTFASCQARQALRRSGFIIK